MNPKFSKRLIFYEFSYFFQISYNILIVEYIYFYILLQSQMRNKKILDYALKELKEKAKSDSNLFQYIINAVKAQATLGEISNILRTNLPPFFCTLIAAIISPNIIL